jgi:hypothetical protein
VIEQEATETQTTGGTTMDTQEEASIETGQATGNGANLDVCTAPRKKSLISCKKVMVADLLVETCPIDWDNIQSTKANIPETLKGTDNAAKWKHVLDLAVQVCNQEHKTKLGSNPISQEEANEAAAHLMKEMLNLETQVGSRTADYRPSSRQKSTVIGLGMRYQKYVKRLKTMQQEDASMNEDVAPIQTDYL